MCAQTQKHFKSLCNYEAYSYIMNHELTLVGFVLGFFEGPGLGGLEGLNEGPEVGPIEGLIDGDVLGLFEGEAVGAVDGLCE